MQAVRQRIERVAERYTEKDPRDAFTWAARERHLTDLEERHALSLRAGGPDAVSAQGFPWEDYGGHTRSSKHSASIRLVRDLHAIRKLRTHYGQDVELFSGKRGKGKTMWAIYMAALFYSIAYNVFSNTSCDFGHRLTGASDLLGLLKSPAFTVWLMDEVQQAFNRFRQSAKFQRNAIGAVAALRKNQSALFGVTSQEHELGYDFKAVTKWAFYPYSVKLGGNIPNMAPWMRTRAIRIGPWPEEWAGSTLAGQRGLTFLNDEPEATRRLQPTPWELFEVVPALYGSFQGVPSTQEAGGNLMARDVDEVNMDRSIDMVDVIDFGDDEGGPETDAHGRVLVTEAEFKRALIFDALAGLVETFGDEAPTTMELALLVDIANAAARAAGRSPYDFESAQHTLRLYMPTRGTNNKVALNTLKLAASTFAKEGG